MDFEFVADQEMLRESVRRFLADKAPIAYVRAQLDDERGALGRDAVWAGLRDLGVIGLLVPEEHGGAGMGMVDAAVVLEELGRAVRPGPYASSAIGAVSLVLARATSGSTGSCCPASPTARRSARSRSSSRARATDWRIAGDRRARRRRRRVAARRHQGARRRRGRGRRRRSSPRATPTARSACSRCSRTPTASPSTPTPTVDGSRKEATVDARRRAGVAARHAATPSAAVARDARPAGSRRGRRRCGRRAARARARGRVREGARAVRQADRLVPGRAAPVRRHAARASSSAAPRATTRAGRADDADPDEAHRAAMMAKAFASRRVLRSSAAPRSRCSAASASRGSTTSTCTTSDCSRCRRPAAAPPPSSTSSPPSPSTDPTLSPRLCRNRRQRWIRGRTRGLSQRRWVRRRQPQVAAAGAGDADLGGAGHLAVAGLAPQLGARLVQEAVAVQPAGRELAAVGVERQHAVARDARRRPRRTGRSPPPPQKPSASSHDIVMKRSRRRARPSARRTA